MNYKIINNGDTVRYCIGENKWGVGILVYYNGIDFFVSDSNHYLMITKKVYPYKEQPKKKRPNPEKGTPEYELYLNTVGKSASARYLMQHLNLHKVTENKDYFSVLKVILGFFEIVKAAKTIKKKYSKIAWKMVESEYLAARKKISPEKYPKHVRDNALAILLHTRNKFYTHVENLRKQSQLHSNSSRTSSEANRTGA